LLSRVIQHRFSRRRLRSTIAFCLCLIAVHLSAFASDPPATGLDATLAAKYLKKVFTLRGFYADEYLRYDNGGSVTGTVHPESWTTSMVEIGKIKVTSNTVEFKGKRWVEIYDYKASKFVATSTGQSVRIVLDRMSSQPNSAVLDAINRIFISDEKTLADLMPDYWKPMISGIRESVPQEDGSDCHRMKGALTRTVDGGICMACEEHAKIKTPLPAINSIDLSSLPYYVGKGVSPPKAVFSPDPTYPEIAKKARFQGTSVLALTVNANGDPTNVTISKPCGFGLDEQSVGAVKTWRFQPARLNGQSVAVMINVEVQFQLY
jgi:TonB family protein